MYALRTLYAPGSLVAGYREGDEVNDAVVENWALTPGVDVAEDRPEPDAPAVVTVPRPDDGANRATWESYAMANGMTADEAAAATQDELEGVEPAAPTETNEGSATGARPAESARKAEWITYVSRHPQATDEDQAWAGDSETTKADLQAWQPGGAQAAGAQAAGAQAADPVAESANEATRQG